MCLIGQAIILYRMTGSWRLSDECYATIELLICIMLLFNICYVGCWQNILITLNIYDMKIISDKDKVSTWYKKTNAYLM